MRHGVREVSLQEQALNPKFLKKLARQVLVTLRRHSAH